jgi:hypothetical protein
MLNTRWAQYRLAERGPLPDSLPERAWARIAPLEATDAR